MAGDSRKQIRGRMKKCPVCGREFWCYDPVLWAYRERNGAGKPKGHICSWSCQAKHNAAIEVKMAKRQKMRPPTAAEVEPTKRKAYDRGAERYLLEGLGGVMNARKISAYKLAALCGISRSSVSEYRNLLTKCGTENVQRLADALGVPPEDLIIKKEGTV